MDFQDRFKDRSSLLTKTGLLTILNAPGIPIPKTNSTNASPFFIPASHAQFLPSISQINKPPSGASSQHISNNSGLSFVSKSSYSRQSPLEVQSNRVSPQNVFLLTRRTSAVRTPSTRESSRGLRTRRNIHDSSYAKVLEGDTTSFMLDSRYSKNKNRSVEAPHSNEADFIPEPRYQVAEKSFRERSKEGKENNKDYNIVKNAIESVERFQLRGASREMMNSERELVPNYEKSNIRVRASLVPNISHERKPLGNILPQLEKVENLNIGSTKSVLLSFRERESQAAAHLKQYTQKNNAGLEEKKPLKSKSLEKVLILKDRDQLENFKVEFMKKEEDRKIERSITGGRLRIPITEREKGIAAETERLMKKVSFKEDNEIMTARCDSRQRQNRHFKLSEQILERVLNKQSRKPDEKDKENFFNKRNDIDNFVLN